MKKHLIYLLISTLYAGIQLPSAVGQATDKRLYGGINLIKGVGRYNGVSFGVGFSGRYQYPLTRTVALTAKLGLEIYRIDYTYVLPSSYLGYGYNAITGFGFNTLYYNYYPYEYRATGINIPFSFGPRVYLTNNVHTDLNVGVDIAANEAVASVFHVEPGVGYTLPLPNGHLLDINTSYFTSFARGSGGFSIGVAYGLKLTR